MSGLTGGIILHRDAIERADIDTKLAAGAVVGNHLGPGDVLDLHALNGFTELILDAGNGAEDRTNPALDAALSVNYKQLFFLAADGVGGTLQLTNAASDTSVSYEIRHL
jgi:hypothetical protein